VERLSKPKQPGPWDPPSTAASTAAPARAAACGQCGAAAVLGLAACPYCEVAYPGVPPGVKCPGCGKLNASRRTACVGCAHDLTRPCVHCHACSPLELVACWHCHRPFPGERGDGDAAGGARPGATTAEDPCHVLAALDEILKT
jgi:hypothetical protein